MEVSPPMPDFLFCTSLPVNGISMIFHRAPSTNLRICPSLFSNQFLSYRLCGGFARWKGIYFVADQLFGQWHEFP